MNVNALVMELLAQLDEEGILNEGSTEIDLEDIDPKLHTGIIEIGFHVDLMTDGTRKVHCDGLRLQIMEPIAPTPAPEQFPEGFRPKGVG